MDTRRSMLKKLAAGGAAAASAPTASLSAVEAAQAAAGLASLPAGPAPWWLFAPVSLGAPLAFGWSVAGLSPVKDGASVLTLAHASGRKADVHLCAHDGSPRGVGHSALVDMVLMDGASGNERTNEELGRVILGLAERVRRNEVDANGDLVALARMMTHDARVMAFGAESFVGGHATA